MITWLHLAPLLALPTAVVSILCALPTLSVNHRLMGGGPLREWLLNHVALPVMPNALGAELVAWFQQASVAQEWLLCGLIAININAVLLPVLYLIAALLIRFSSWSVAKDLALKRNAVRH